MGTIHHIARFLVRSLVLPAALLFSSCIKDDLSRCGLDVVFRYTYNIVGADAFSREADWVHLYVFDGSGSLVMQERTEGVRGDEDFRIRIPLTTAGEYSLVAFAGSSGAQDFIIPEMNEGDPEEKLTASVARDVGGLSSERLNSLLIGTLDTDIDGTLRTVTVDMMKCTHTVRVILMPMQGDKELAPEDYDFTLEDRCGTLACDASPLGEDEVIYKPCFLAGTSGSNSSWNTYAGAETAPASGDGAVASSSAVVAEFSTSRLMRDFEPRLVIRNNLTGSELMDIDLTWFLSLQEIEEHRSEWSDQEYLDRQDEYAITFFIDNDSWFQTRIIVNGWVISFENVEL